ncbi:hypothetical protein E0H54_24140 [Rhizobium leguminosarum bv. viciae]|nr:hypothetical protein E0H54_24140 [Rhizobium leguminosarum bv. viciae]
MSVSLGGVLRPAMRCRAGFSDHSTALWAVPRTIDKGAISELPAIFDSGRLMTRFLGILTGLRKFITNGKRNAIDAAGNSAKAVTFSAFR